MADEFNPSNQSSLFSPMMLWTDLGMRALEMTLSSTQNIGDGLDRLARAGASAEVVDSTERADSGHQAQEPDEDASPGLAMALKVQRTAFEMMTQSWQQWMKMLGTLASIGAGTSSLGATVASGNPLLDALREGMQWGGARPAAGKPRRAAIRSDDRQGGRASRMEDLEHAFARAEPKRRSRGSRAKSSTRRARAS